MMVANTIEEENELEDSAEDLDSDDLDDYHEDNSNQNAFLQ